MLPTSHFISLITINAVFAGAYLAGKEGVGHFPPFFFTGLRFLIVLIPLMLFFRIRPVMQTQHKGAFWMFCFAMGIGVYSTMYSALALVDGVSHIFIGTQFSVPIAALLGVFIMKEQVNRLMWLGISMAFIGVMVVGYEGALLGYWEAFLLILISASFYALANVLSQKLDGQINVMNLNCWLALVTAPAMFFLSWIFEENQLATLATADAKDWFILLYSSLVVSLVGHVGIFLLLRRHPISVIMPYYVLTPILGIIGGIFLFDEEPSGKFYIGTIIALTGVYVVNRYRNRNKVPQATSCEK